MVAQKRRKKSFSYVLYVMYVLLLLVIIGDIIGASLYIKLEQSSQSLMVNYVNENSFEYPGSAGAGPRHPTMAREQ